jgi:hypothetical protein
MRWRIECAISDRSRFRKEIFFLIQELYTSCGYIFGIGADTKSKRCTSNNINNECRPNCSLGVPGLIFTLTKHDCLKLDHIKHFVFDEYEINCVVELLDIDIPVYAQGNPWDLLAAWRWFHRPLFFRISVKFRLWCIVRTFLRKFISTPACKTTKYWSPINLDTIDSLIVFRTRNLHICIALVVIELKLR